jgi:hypothetical protein
MSLYSDDCLGTDRGANPGSEGCRAKAGWRSALTGRGPLKRDGWALYVYPKRTPRCPAWLEATAAGWFSWSTDWRHI